MLNLEQSIIEWRRHMFDSGVKNPNILDELEAHLRDEIEQQAKSGLSEADAFQIAVEKIGKAHPIQKEFKKVAKGHKIIRPILLVIGWLAASYALADGVAVEEFFHFLFGFSPKWQLTLIEPMLEILVALTALWFLAKASRDKASRAASLLVCVLFAKSAFKVLRETPKGGLPSPIWFRIALALILCAPGAFWFWWMRRHLTEQRALLSRLPSPAP